MKNLKDNAKAGPFAEKADRKCDMPKVPVAFPGTTPTNQREKGPFAPCETEPHRHRSNPE